MDFLHLKKVDPSLSIWYIHLTPNEALQLASYFEANYFDAIVGKTLIDCFMTRKLMEDFSEVFKLEIFLYDSSEMQRERIDEIYIYIYNVYTHILN